MKLFLLVGAALLALAGVPASAAAVDWTFGDHTGSLGTTQSFTSSGIGLSLLARGFDGSIAEHGVNLFGKTCVGTCDERGLGLTNDGTGDDEISGHSLIQLNLDGIRNRLSNFQFSMNSTTDGESWKVYGSEDATPFTFVLLASGSDEGVLHSLAGGYDNYNFVSTNGNVLIGAFDAVADVPEPATWAMMLLGFIGIGLVSIRRMKQGRSFRIA